MSQVIYARVPDGLKEATDVYSHSKGTTLTRAVVDLLERGLAAVSDEPSIAELESELVRLSTEKTRLETELQTTRAETAALQSLTARVNQNVGTCPSCRSDISGYDLLATGQCSECGQTLTELVAPTEPPSNLNQREFMLLLGALGAVVGVAILASGKAGGAA